MSVVKEKVCRGCLVVSTAELSQAHYETLNSFKTICGLTISNESKLPNRLCNNCLRLLNQCQQFRINCQKSSKVLTELLKINQDGKFKIKELYNKRSKQIYETHPLELAELSTIECSQRNNIFNSSINSSQNSIFTSAAKLNLNDSETRLIGDVDQLTQYPTTDSTKIKDIEWNKELCSVDLYDANNGPPPLVFFDSDDERHKIDTDLPIKRELEHEYECFDSPAPIDIKEEIINVTNETLVEDLLANRKGSDLKKKCFKLKTNQKNKKTNIRCIAIDKLKGKLKKKVDKVRVGADERIKRKHRVSNYSFDKSAVNVNKLSYQEQLCALETARNRVEYLEAPFKCKPCAKYFVHELSMQGHMKRHDESAGEYICKICTQRYSSLRNLQSHDAIHRERLQCKQCLQVLCGRVSMAKHIAHAHNDYYATFECDICRKVATSKHNLRRHMLTHSTSKENKCKCPYCPKTFSLSTSRNDHATRAHSKGERYFPCKICKRSFLNKTLLRMHAITHSDKKDFYCVECDIHFKRKNSLDRHLKISMRHGNQSSRFKCDLCEKRYDTPLRLKEHLNSSHLRVFNFTCDKCPSKFLTGGGLRIHRRKIHEGKVDPKNHICGVCSKAFQSKNLLVRHMRIHTGELPYGCHICDRLFRQKSTLETHIKLVHLKLKRPFGKHNRMADMK